MPLSRYLLIMASATLLCWLTWLVTLFNVNPFEAGFLSFLAFYASLFLALCGTFAIVGFVLRAWIFKQDEPHFRHVQKTFRHGLLFSALIILALLLQSQRLLRWWSIILLVLLFTFLEIIFITKPKAG